MNARGSAVQGVLGLSVQRSHRGGFFTSRSEVAWRAKRLNLAQATPTAPHTQWSGAEPREKRGWVSR
jgi:hypothetical protein